MFESSIHIFIIFQDFNSQSHLQYHFEIKFLNTFITLGDIIFLVHIQNDFTVNIGFNYGKKT